MADRGFPVLPTARTGDRGVHSGAVDDGADRVRCAAALDTGSVVVASAQICSVVA